MIANLISILFIFMGLVLKINDDEINYFEKE